MITISTRDSICAPEREWVCNVILFMLPDLDLNITSINLEVEEDPSVTAGGRMLSLGSFYDSRKDLVLNLPSPWNTKSLIDATYIEENSSSVHDVSRENFNGRANLLGVTGELELSLLSGLVTFSGSGNYFNCSTISYIKTRISLSVAIRTVSKKLSLDSVKKLILQRPMLLLEQVSGERATHLITSIQYGARSVFVFEGSVCPQVLLEAILSIPGVQINHSIFKKNTVLEQSVKDLIKVYFFTDYFLTDVVVTFDDVAHMIQKMNKGITGDGVPIDFQIYPIHDLDKRVPKSYRKISRATRIWLKTIFSDIEKNMGHLHDKVSEQLLPFKNLKNEIEQEMEKYRSFIRFQLSKLLPYIRESSNTDEDDLHRLIKLHINSPFHFERFMKWSESIGEANNALRSALRFAPWDFNCEYKYRYKSCFDRIREVPAAVIINVVVYAKDEYYNRLRQFNLNLMSSSAAMMPSTESIIKPTDFTEAYKVFLKIRNSSIIEKIVHPLQTDDRDTLIGATLFFAGHAIMNSLNAYLDNTQSPPMTAYLIVSEGRVREPIRCEVYRAVKGVVDAAPFMVFSRFYKPVCASANATGTAVRISWTAPQEGMHQIREFIIFRRTSFYGRREWDVEGTVGCASGTPPGHSFEFVVSDLVPGKRYKWKIKMVRLVAASKCTALDVPVGGDEDNVDVGHSVVLEEYIVPGGKDATCREDASGQGGV